MLELREDWAPCRPMLESKAKRVHISMLIITSAPITNDDAKVSDFISEGAVDPAIQADVPLDPQAALPICQVGENWWETTYSNNGCDASEFG